LEPKIACLDKGYVRLVTWLPWDMVSIRQIIDQADPNDLVQCSEAVLKLKELMGQDDLATVNAARASFLKESDRLSERDRRLIRFLAARYELSPFRHATLTFEIKAPLMVARQWWKYVVGSEHTRTGLDTAWNESSRRYVTVEPEFYSPDEWRGAPASKKQGSSGPLPQREQDGWTEALKQYVEEGLRLYGGALERGVAAEQARLFLPAYGLYLVWRWTASLAAVCHFLNERLAEKAQKEIQTYAEAVWKLVKYAYPESLSALVKQE